MGLTVLTGKDTITIAGRVINDLPDGDVAALTFPNELVNLKVGKNGNTLYAFNNTGKQCDFVLRVLRASSDDKFLNTYLITMEDDFAAFNLMTGEFTKRLGDGQGKITRDIYLLEGGVITKRVEAKENVDGDEEQLVSVYNFKFSNAPRVIA
jgi:hypothetical protein